MKFKEFECIEQKAQYLRNHYPFVEVPKLTDVQCCIHCGENFIVGDFKVRIEGSNQCIVCPNAPKCNGNCIDWTDVDKEGTKSVIENLMYDRIALIEVLEVYLDHVKKNKTDNPDSLKEIHKRMKNTIKEIKQLNQ